jgi:DUF1707 SHOCT-like domain
MVRASDGDREAATASLGRHYASGRLSLDELNERVQHALSARSRRELAWTLRDLPPLWRDRDGVTQLTLALQLRGRRLVRRALFLGGVVAGWMTLNALLLFALIVVAVVHGVTLLEIALLPVAWLVTTMLALRIVRRR